jgi:hypothetical protein
MQVFRMDETAETKVLCHSRDDAIKIPTCSKAVSTKYRPIYYTFSPAIVTSKGVKNYNR